MVGDDIKILVKWFSFFSFLFFVFVCLFFLLPIFVLVLRTDVMLSRHLAKWARTFFPHAQHASHTLHVRLRFVTYLWHSLPSNQVKSPNLLLTLLWVAKEPKHNFQSRGRCSLSDEFVCLTVKAFPNKWCDNWLYQQRSWNNPDLISFAGYKGQTRNEVNLLPRSPDLNVFRFNNQVLCPRLIQTFLNSSVWWIFSLFVSISQYLDHIKHTVIENVKCLTGAPSVQMQEVPPDFMCLESVEDQRDPNERHDDDSRWGRGE